MLGGRCAPEWEHHQRGAQRQGEAGSPRRPGFVWRKTLTMWMNLPFSKCSANTDCSGSGSVRRGLCDAVQLRPRSALALPWAPAARGPAPPHAAGACAAERSDELMAEKPRTGSFRRGVGSHTEPPRRVSCFYPLVSTGDSAVSPSLPPQQQWSLLRSVRLSVPGGVGIAGQCRARSCGGISCSEPCFSLESYL